MRAAAISAHGGLDQVRIRTDWLEPAAGPGQAVVEVKACGLNYLDIFVLQGMPGLPVEMPRIPGGDIAGVVHAVGSGVSREWIGRRVLVDPHIKPGGALGEHANGGLCERIAVDADNLIHMPDAVTFEQAAALPIAYGTAYRMMITRGHVKAGELVLILGASGGVGTGCVQIARNLGARIIACASSPEKLRRLKELGADHVIDYTNDDFSKTAWEISGKKGVDVLVNYTGGDTWVPSLRTLARHGRLLTCGATAGFDPRTDIRYIWRREVTIVGANGWTRQDLEALLLEVERGAITPIIDRVLPLAESAEAMRLLQDREVFGKVIVIP
ncbi:MAG TPA: zinc-binding dehydrogenase [Candidatus Limnocylindria bacterium]|nr:zinc-binding dehydrogenase [Candidatus Limnocylindria bacterium]